jgi:hypothetical protein
MRNDSYRHHQPNPQSSEAIMTPRLAAHATVHDYPGGSIALGPMMGISASFLRTAVNPHSRDHSLTIERACQLMSITNDPRILAAMADEIGYSIIKLPSFEISDSAVLESYTAMLAELGEFSGVFNQSLADNKINRKEFDRMREEMNQTIAAALALIGRIEQLVE